METKMPISRAKWVGCRLLVGLSEVVLFGCNHRAQRARRNGIDVAPRSRQLFHVNPARIMSCIKNPILLFMTRTIFGVGPAF